MRICLDIDGVLTPDVKGRGGPEAYYLRPPYPNAVYYVRRFHKLGHRIILMTARGCKSFGSKESAEAFHRPHLEEWLRKYDIPFDELHWKPIADVYVDDKAFNMIGAKSSSWEFLEHHLNVME